MVPPHFEHFESACMKKLPECLGDRAAAERPKLSDPARGTRGWQPERDGWIRCSALLGGMVMWSEGNASVAQRKLGVDRIAPLYFAPHG
jgi:hypothetical protein